MTVYVYHGKARGVKALQLARYNCVLTTYNSMSMEASAKGKQGSHPDDVIELDDDVLGQNAPCV